MMYSLFFLCVFCNICLHFIARAADTFITSEAKPHCTPTTAPKPIRAPSPRTIKPKSTIPSAVTLAPLAQPTGQGDYYKHSEATLNGIKNTCRQALSSGKAVGIKDACIGILTLANLTQYLVDVLPQVHKTNLMAMQVAYGVFNDIQSGNIPLKAQWFFQALQIHRTLGWGWSNSLWGYGYDTVNAFYWQYGKTAELLFIL